MAFSDFTSPEVATTFGLVEQTVPLLFASVPAAAVPPRTRHDAAAQCPSGTGNQY
jgi:hypothetical protein